MTESCVTVVTDQSVDGLAQYLPIKNSVAKSDSIARVSDPGGTVFLSAVFEGDWFMCTLTAERMSKSDVIELTDGWTSYTSARLEISSNRQLDLSGRSILIPASVTCGDEGAEIVVYATRSDDVFMVVVTSELPESASDPCVERT